MTTGPKFIIVDDDKMSDVGRNNNKLNNLNLENEF